MQQRYETFTVLINRISRNVRKIKNQEMAEYDLRSVHISCLYHLYLSDGLTATELCERCEEDKATILRQRKFVKPNVFSLLSRLKQKYRLGIISNYSASMLDYLQEAKLTEYFETIIISEIVGYEKPDPKIYEYFLAKMNCEAKDCLYVGDHPFDVMGAKRAGMDVAWLNQIYEDLPEYISECPDYVIQNIGELTLILYEKKRCVLKESTYNKSAA